LAAVQALFQYRHQQHVERGDGEESIGQHRDQQVGLEGHQLRIRQCPCGRCGQRQQATDRGDGHDQGL
jgi:hypothetical protein